MKTQMARQQQTSPKLICYMYFLYNLFTEVVLGFEMSEYLFNESAGFLSQSVYIVRENEVIVSSNFRVTVVLLKDSTATDGRLYLLSSCK